MRVVSVVNGTAAVRLVSEDIVPKRRPPMPDYIAAIAGRFDFMERSDSSSPPFTFLNGRAMVREGEMLQFAQLQIARNGMVVASQNTSDADNVLTDFLNFLVNDFGFNIDVTGSPRSYLSDLIVEFDGSKKNVLSSLVFIEEELNKRIIGRRNLKSLTFGVRQDEVVLEGQAGATLIGLIERADFVIERRVDSDPAANRFYSRAPLSTDDHVAALEALEVAESGF